MSTTLASLSYETTNNHLITIIGNVGAGKTTLTELLAQELPALKVDADSIFAENPYFQRFVRNKKKWGFHTELWFLAKRAEILHQNLPHLASQHVVIDSGLLMGYAYAYNGYCQGYMNEVEWQIYTTFFNQVTTTMAATTTIINLTASTDALMQRIQARGRDYELAMYDDTYLNELDRSIENLKQVLSQGGVRIIDVDVEATDIRQKNSLNVLKQHFGSKTYQAVL